jgi:hypothetical protein
MTVTTSSESCGAANAAAMDFAVATIAVAIAIGAISMSAFGDAGAFTSPAAGGGELPPFEPGTNQRAIQELLASRPTAAKYRTATAAPAETTAAKRVGSS